MSSTFFCKKKQQHLSAASTLTWTNVQSVQSVMHEVQQS